MNIRELTVGAVATQVLVKVTDMCVLADQLRDLPDKEDRPDIVDAVVQIISAGLNEAVGLASQMEALAIKADESARNADLTAEAPRA